MIRNDRGYTYNAPPKSTRADLLLLLMLSIAVFCFYLGTFFQSSQHTTITKLQDEHKMVQGRFGHRSAEYAPIPGK